MGKQMVPRSSSRKLVAYLSELGCQEIDSIYVDGAPIRGDGIICWACNDRLKFSSGAWFAALIGGLGSLVESSALYFKISETDIVGFDIILGNAQQRGGTLEGSIPFENRRQVVALFEKWRNYGSWQLALSDNPNFPSLDGFSFADVFIDVDLDANAYGFVRLLKP